MLNELRLPLVILNILCQSVNEIKVHDVCVGSVVGVTINIVMMMFFELFLLRKISEFPSGTRTHNLIYDRR